ncbi:MAG: hypothetical protein HF314_12125 [Ignavibacteria bacterium]|jgi:hypothetical protein|nr:hypothetical protein [Ignavibacteria bacterium]MCU7503818.1 hypothetical protein [Ignavibacteria bacterium]MCU7517168.1 hypothetical protein [Ignavibacteria bacterium]
MSWKENQEKQERIERFGQTVDLPLFDQKSDHKHSVMPSWIFNGTDLKGEVYRAMEEKLQPNQNKVIEALLSLQTGSDHDIKDYLGWEINQVTGRRKALQMLGIIEFAFKRKLGPYGSPNCVWKLNYQRLKEVLDL